MRLSLKILVARFLGRFHEVRKLRTLESETQTRMQLVWQECNEHRATTKAITAERDSLKAKLSETERGLAIMTEARLNADRYAESIKAASEAKSEAHAAEVDGLKRMIDFFSPMLGGRTVFGLTPVPKVDMSDEKMQPHGAQNRRSLSREAYDQFYQQALAQMKSGQGLDPNPNGEQVPDFSVKPQ